ncbi:uncharacterized protein LOC129746488 isoform X2 [Uranotaenia lowii]|nr:uncharacterized protein LOC129746488 isoform X2 [Uranotaenia lowii]
MNSINTAYVMATFDMKYFISFRQGTNDRFEENNCKIPMKSLLKIFRSLHKILICKIWLQLDKKKIVFQFQCKSHILKTHIIPLMEHEHTNSLRLPESFSNKVIGDHKIFGKILKQFHRSVHEITFDAKADETIITNYIENTGKERTAMRSTFSIDSSAFRVYDLDVPTNITFYYKEFKAMAYYAEHNRMLVEMNFDQAGTPLLVRMKKEGVLSIHFILGTMTPRTEKQNRNLQRATRRLANQSKSKAQRSAESQLIESCHTQDSDEDINSNYEDDSRNSHLRGGNQSNEHTSVGTPLEPLPSLQIARRSEYQPTSNQNQSEVSFLNGIPMPPGESSKKLEPCARLTKDLESSPQPQPSLEVAQNCEYLTTNRHDQSIAESSRSSPAPPLARVSTVPESYDIIFVGNSDDPNSESQDLLSPKPSAKRRSNSQLFQCEKRPYLDVQTEPMFSDVPQTSGTIRSTLVNLAGIKQRQTDLQSEPMFSDAVRVSGTTSDRIQIPDLIPESPEAIAEKKRKQEKMRHIFRKCFESTFDPQQINSHCEVYAENSDPEETVE